MARGCREHTPLVSRRRCDRDARVRHRPYFRRTRALTALTVRVAMTPKRRLRKEMAASRWMRGHIRRKPRSATRALMGEPLANEGADATLARWMGGGLPARMAMPSWATTLRMRRAPESSAGDDSASESLDGGCTGSQVRCSDAQPQACANGTWIDNGAACAGPLPFCLAGACVPCRAGMTRCDYDLVESCVESSGQWTGSGLECLDQACIAGACTGVCWPGRTSCADGGVATCLATGTWSAPTACACGGSCSNTDSLVFMGACSGCCAPGSRQCSEAGIQSCDVTGDWDAGVACPRPARAGRMSVRRSRPQAAVRAVQALRTVEPARKAAAPARSSPGARTIAPSPMRARRKSRTWGTQRASVLSASTSTT